MMDWSNLWDPVSALVVLGGTVLATMLRSGWRDLGATMAAIGALMRPPFDMLKTRSSLAGQVRTIRRDGYRVAEPAHSDDAETAEAADALAHRGSLQAAIKAHERHAAKRDRRRASALATLMQMGELAPVFGLAGTLLALAQLPSDAMLAEDLLGAVSTAVLSTLYGLLLAHLIVMPIARKIERRGEDEERAREEIFTWLHDQLHEDRPPAKGHAPRLHAVSPDHAA